eukprot:665854-Pyramimonas_sp.AAC.1
MHVLFASSGMAQYEVNYFCANLTEATAFTLDLLDRFSGSFSPPKPLRGLPRKFFQDRTRARGSHIKAYAGET